MYHSCHYHVALLYVHVCVYHNLAFSALSCFAALLTIITTAIPTQAYARDGLYQFHTSSQVLHQAPEGTALEPVFACHFHPPTKVYLAFPLLVGWEMRTLLRCQRESGHWMMSCCTTSPLELTLWRIPTLSLPFLACFLRTYYPLTSMAGTSWRLSSKMSQMSR